jgi:hypothetical protein
VSFWTQAAFSTLKEVKAFWVLIHVCSFPTNVTAHYLDRRTTERERTMQSETILVNGRI